MDGAETPLGRSPPMGWNSWNAYSCAVTEADIRATADAMVESGLRDAGYEYLVVDDCWMADDRPLRADPTDFPSGVAALAEYVHDRGLRFGLYSSAGTHTCQRYPASLGHEQSHAEQFAEWGVDYLKYDNCGDHRGRDPLDRYASMGRALEAVDREIVYSICEWGQNDPWRWGRNAGGELWRVTDDIVAKWQAADDEFGLGIVDVIDRVAELEVAGYQGPYGWNDPDMLQVGNGPESGQSRHEPTDVRRPLSDAETRSHFAFWCLLGAPLMVGTDLTTLDDADREILTNEQLLAIDQDPLGLQATADRRDGGVEIWSKRLADGDTAVGLFNRGSDRVGIDTHVAEIGALVGAASYRVRNCWTGATFETEGDLWDSVEPRDTTVYRVSPHG